MRRLLALLALALATPLVAAPRAWTAVATPAAQGSYVIGNPKARVKLIEYVSYTCPHCGHFTQQSASVLKDRFIASGSTSLEVRNAIHDRYDLAAATLARCAGPTLFAKLHDALFAQQSTWLDRAVAFDSANAQRIAMYDQAAQLRALADGAGLTDIARGAGMAPAAIDRCFAEPAHAARTIAVAQVTSARIRATPTFELNGRLIENVDWAKLEPMLRAAGAR